jgi:hypothetical protein
LPKIQLHLAAGRLRNLRMSRRKIGLAANDGAGKRTTGTTRRKRNLGRAADGVTPSLIGGY